MIEENHNLVKLKKRIKEANKTNIRRIQLILGTGVTVNITDDERFLWHNIIISGLERIKTSYYDGNEIETNRINAYIKKVKSNERTTSVIELLSIASLIINEVTFGREWKNSDDYSIWLKDTFGDPLIANKELILALKFAKINGAEFITTNYDHILKDKLKLKVYQRNKINDFISSNDGILHLHGDYLTHEPPIVFCLESYENFLDDPLLNTQILELFNPKKNLNIFIGCGNGLNDPNFNVFFDFYEKVVKNSKGEGVDTFIIVEENDYNTIAASFNARRIKHNYRFVQFKGFDKLAKVVYDCFDYPNPLKVFMPLFDTVDKYIKNELIKQRKTVKNNELSAPNIRLDSDILLADLLCVSQEFNQLLYLGNKVESFANLLRLTRYALFSETNQAETLMNATKRMSIIKEFFDTYNAEFKRCNLERYNLINPFFIQADISIDTLTKESSKFEINYPNLVENISKYVKLKKMNIKARYTDENRNGIIKMIDAYIFIMQSLSQIDNGVRVLYEKSMNNEVINGNQEDSNNKELHIDYINHIMNIRNHTNNLLTSVIKYNKYLIKLNYTVFGNPKTANIL